MGISFSSSVLKKMLKNCFLSTDCYVFKELPCINRTSYDFVGTSHMSNNLHMSVAMQRLVDFISMVTQQYVTTQQYRRNQYITTQQY
jgi:hypothetical protein